MSTQLTFPGQYDLDGVLVVGSSGLPVEIGNLISEIHIYQDLDSPHMSGSILLTDGDDLSSTVPFIGNERLLFSIRTPGRTPIDYNTYHAVMYNVQSRVSTSDNSQTVLLEFTSLDNFKNTHTKISKAFNGQISDIVEKILRADPKGLKSKKSFHWEETKGVRKFVIPNMSPFAAIHMLKEEAIAKDEKDFAHYLFYENPEGYHFRSLDSLLGKGNNLSTASKGTYIYQHPSSATSGQSAKVNPAGALETILHWEIHDNSNSIINFKKGMYASTLLTHDIFNKNVQKFTYNYEAKYNKRHSLNMTSNTHGPIISKLKQDNNKNLTEQYDSRTFLHPTGKGLFVKTAEDSDKAIHNNSDTWLQESVARYVERISNFILQIETYGNTDIVVGDIINVLIPKNYKTNTGKASVDTLLSGRYIITHICHFFNIADQKHTMHMLTMKDSFANAPTQMDSQFKEEPRGISDKGLSETRILDPWASAYIKDRFESGRG